jgi:hypothetical protein
MHGALVWCLSISILFSALGSASEEKGTIMLKEKRRVVIHLFFIIFSCFSPFLLLFLKKTTTKHLFFLFHERPQGLVCIVDG